MATDTSEKGLERVICTALTGSPCDPGAKLGEEMRERPAVYGAGWICGAPEDYDREYCVNLARLSAFLRETQPERAEALDLGWNDGAGNPPNPNGLKTDYLRKILDKQIKDTIKQFAQVGATVGHAEHTGDLRNFIAEGKKIIISTVQKFPFILDEIGSEHRKRGFAIIDEAHSSQGGRTSAAVSMALGTAGAEEDDETTEDKIDRLMEAKKLLPNASYFAFTATPKNKTLEIFGEPEPQPAGKVRHRPFHSYTMKQAIQEGFILDVLKYYTPVASYYKLVKKVEGNPEFDTKRAKKKLRRYVESHEHAIRLKTEIMVDHFHEQVLALGKIGGQARAMVVTSGIERTIQYYYALRDYLAERKSPYRAIVAFTGEHVYGGAKVTEASLNAFPSIKIADKIQEDPYRFLICAEKFQTGYDEPLLHTMYVDKVLSGIKAVQTLSRLNRAHRKNSDKQNARIEHDKALQRVMTAVLKDDTELFKQFMDNESFRRWMTDTVFGLTYEPSRTGT
jgi:type I site-specific restriction-modification system R (restriction) subunit